MTDEAKALVDRYSVCAGDKPYTNGIRDLAEMPHVSEQLGNVFRDCAHIIDAQNDRIEALEAALSWALIQLGSETGYNMESPIWHAYDRARSVLNGEK